MSTSPHFEMVSNKANQSSLPLWLSGTREIDPGRGVCPTGRGGVWYWICHTHHGRTSGWKGLDDGERGKYMYEKVAANPWSMRI